MKGQPIVSQEDCFWPQEEVSNGLYQCFQMAKQGICQQTPLWKRWDKLHCYKKLPSNVPSCSEDKPLPPDIPLSSGRLCPPLSHGGISAQVSALIWQSKMWGFEFAGKSMVPTQLGSTQVLLEEKVFVPDFAWRPGWKLDLGYDFGFDGWDLDSRWTYYRGESTHLKKHIDLQINPPGMGVVPLWLYPFYTVSSVVPPQIRFLDSRDSWRHYFNSIDLEIGRLSSLSKKVSFHLLAGVKGAWMHQYYRVEYSQSNPIAVFLPGSSTTNTITILDSTAVFKNKTWGGGPRVGFDLAWAMGYGLRILGTGAFSLLYSGIETSRDHRDLNQNTLTQAVQELHMHMATSSHQLKPVAETKLGLDWQMYLCEHSIVALTIAYELQYWWAQNSLRRNYSHALPGGPISMRGDLQMHGLTATAGYHY